MTDHRDTLRAIRTFPQLVKFLRDELDWPIDSDDFEELTFDYTPEELGIDATSAAKIQEIKRLRPLSAGQPWGIFFVKFEPRRLPVVALRRVLSRVVLKKRASANSAERAAWQADDLLFVSNYGEGDERQISFAHFSQHGEKADLPTLKVLGWDDLDTPLHLDDVADVLRERLAWPEDEEDVERWRQTWRSAFTLRHREVITTAKVLAVRLAELARAIRNRIRTVLAIETEKGPVTRLMKAFQAALIHDLTADDFADMYAQTIAYGLLSARVANPTHHTADAASDQIPVTNPFLKELMETFLHLGGRKRKTPEGEGIDFDELGVSEVVELLDAANMEAVVRDFGDRNRAEDPVIHFYELFLKEYDAKKRMQRGVFYTPQPVVSYIVRSVHELLQTEFGLEGGLASTATWGDMAAKHTGLKVPDGVKPTDAFVQILDPATGTATFLVEVIDVIHRTLVAKWNQQGLSETQQRAAWNNYVPKHLLPRLHGYELMMAPYAIAHMKIGLKLYETGYRFGSDERARIYLTNALEPPQDFSDRLAFDAPALAHEAQAVNAIKRHQRFTVVIGNPPYSIQSQNLTDEARRWVEPYRYVDGELIREKGALQFEKSLQDDCVKFASFSQRSITDSSTGLLGLIISHSAVDNPTLRGMRQSLGRAFNALYMFDLHGNSTKKERCPDGSEDKNVFDIKQGVGIVVGWRRDALTAFASVSHADAWGTREAKYALLEKTCIIGTAFERVTPSQPFYLFKPQHASTRDEFERGWRITEAFIKGNVGIITARDEMVIDFAASPLVDRAKVFRDSRLPDAKLCETLGISVKKGWDIPHARALIRQEDDLGRFVKSLCYRPFDIRLIFYHPSLVWGMSYPTMQHMLAGGNLGMTVGRAGQVIGQGDWDIVFCTRHMTEFNLYRRGGHNLLPLYLLSEEDAVQKGLGTHDGRRPNFSPNFLASLASALGIQGNARGLGLSGIKPEAVFHYLYAVLHSLEYRRRYAEFLKIEFPRVPLASRLELFRALSALGAELVSLHLMEFEVGKRDEARRRYPQLAEYTGPAHAEVERVGYSQKSAWLDKAQTRGFRGVPESVWDFHIGGYQVCEKWLKDRKGRRLSKGDVEHYQKIVVALNETIRIMQEIDKVIGKHGGWPGAFQDAKDAVPSDARRPLLAAEEPARYRRRRTRT